MFKPVGLELANSEFLKKWGQGKSDLDQVTGGLELTKLELAALYCLDLEKLHCPWNMQW